MKKLDATSLRCLRVRAVSIDHLIVKQGNDFTCS